MDEKLELSRGMVEQLIFLIEDGDKSRIELSEYITRTYVKAYDGEYHGYCEGLKLVKKDFSYVEDGVVFCIGHSLGTVFPYKYHYIPASVLWSSEKTGELGRSNRLTYELDIKMQQSKISLINEKMKEIGLKDMVLQQDYTFLRQF